MTGVGIIRSWRRRSALKKVKAGDGSALKPYRSWHALWRTRFFHEHTDGSGTVNHYAVDVDLLDLEPEALLYLDGRQVAKAELPAALPVPGGVIEVATQLMGLKRMHFVSETGQERLLRPHPKTAEARRARFGHHHPTMNRVIAGTAIAVLLISLVLVVPQLLEWITQTPAVAEQIGSFESPVSLPAWLTTTVTVAGFAAAAERALTLRNHWLIDADTWWIG